MIEKTFGCYRWRWNQMLSDMQEFYAATGEHYTPIHTRYKKKATFLKKVDSQPLCTVHQNLRQVFLGSFRAPSKCGTFIGLTSDWRKGDCPAFSLFEPLESLCVVGRAAAILGTDAPESRGEKLGAVEEQDKLLIPVLAHTLHHGVRFPLPDWPLNVKQMNMLAYGLVNADS